MKELWVELYRPKTLDGYVFVDKAQEDVIRKWVTEQSIPHLLLSGSPGTGKTTLAKVLMHELNVGPGDCMEINASMDNGIDVVRDRIASFAATCPFGEFKYIILDEADQMTKAAQLPLRNLIETYSGFCRFILTCNYPEKIDPALKSRLEHFHISQVDKTQFTTRVIDILVNNENVDVDPEIISEYVEATYPDLRSCIKLVQSNTIDKVLHRPSQGASGKDQEYIVLAIAYFKERQYKEARKILTANAKPADYPNLYRTLYTNLDWWADNDDDRSRCILEIADGVRWNDNCADQEINFCATLIKLEQIAE